MNTTRRIPKKRNYIKPKTLKRSKAILETPLHQLLIDQNPEKRKQY